MLSTVSLYCQIAKNRKQSVNNKIGKAKRLFCSTVHLMFVRIKRNSHDSRQVRWVSDSNGWEDARAVVEEGDATIIKIGVESLDCPILTNRTVATASRSGEPFSWRVT